MPDASGSTKQGRRSMNAVEQWLHDGKTRIRREGIKEGIEQGIKEGIEQGIKEGIEQGRVETILFLARSKFGSVPKKLETSLTSATLEELDNWTVRVANASSIDEAMNGDRPRRKKGNGEAA